MKFMKMITIPTEKCLASYQLRNKSPMTNSFFCALIEPCENFSFMPGGPVIVKNKLVGIISLGMRPKGVKPNIFTRISPFMSWVEEETGIKAL